MNKVDFIKKVASETGYSQKDVKAVLDTAQNVIFAEMSNEGEVKVFDGVTFVGQKKPACVKRNPSNGSMVEVPEKIAPKCKFGKAIKDSINA